MKNLMYVFWERMRALPWMLILTVYAIVGLGLYNLYSASSANISPTIFTVQLQWIGIATVAMLIWGVFLDTKSIEQLAFPGYVVVCLLLVAVDVFGKSAKGAERWLQLGPMRLQPSEFTKFLIIIAVAKSFTWMNRTPPFSLFQLWRQILIISIPFLLILVQPDLGTAGLVLMIAALQLLFVRIEWKSIMAVSIAGLTGGAIAWNFFLYDYQKQRVLNFLNPMLDPRGSGYHSLQSMIAVGSGGVWGKGFQLGSQAQLSFLPERHTDFIFSVWAEEHGFVGCLLLFVLYAFLVVQIFQVADRARDTFSSLVALGVAGFFIFHFLINISMVLGVFPVVGVPLTLVSYGGSHMLTAFSCLGLVLAVDRRRQQAHSHPGGYL